MQQLSIKTKVGKAGMIFFEMNRLWLSSFGTKRVGKTAKSRKEHRYLPALLPVLINLLPVFGIFGF